MPYRLQVEVPVSSSYEDDEEDDDDDENEEDNNNNSNNNCKTSTNISSNLKFREI
eukprot:CAMPEP_0194160466 /NCGR_PEP_ID=MMETSP0152-20130528/78408_1 /TAXON_ID=1049557 /ORGANISM="Thalassiothrix antarctica, Strain L6-D1" /LENGTH=54 /DNA_ID=CAMNT_0038870159 /DNA_START=897 /DNA_END=1061 /DNA_ORIENTATION=-